MNYDVTLPETDQSFTADLSLVIKGDKGDPGDTPVRGVDYWTEDDKAEIMSALLVPQELTPEQQAQARASIGALEYYSTTREELEVDGENVNTAYIWGLYDALMAEYPDKVQKNKVHNDDGTFTNYEYVISTGEYNTDGYYYKWYVDKGIKKPKYLILSGIHGLERKAALSAYRFIRDLLSGHNVLAHFRECCVIHIMPVGNPSGIDAFTRTNDNGVDVNRNFDWNWEEKDNGTIHYSGASAASEKETQAIANWLNANADAELFIDCHNSGTVNEVAMVIGLTDNEDCDRAKKIALRGLDRVIPLWRDVIGYQPMETIQWNSKTEENDIVVKDPIFSHSASMNDGGMAIMYVTDVLKITSLCIEFSALQNGNYSDWEENMHLITPETISAGAEALGNVLIEFYEQSLSEVVDMTEVNDKLDNLAESMNSMSRGFHTESGVMVVDADVLPEGDNYLVPVRIPCSNGAKMVTLCADADTKAAIVKEYKQTEPKKYFCSLLGNCFEPNIVDYMDAQRSYMSMMNYREDVVSWHNGWVLDDHATVANNTDGFTFNCYALKGGEVATGKNATYHWTAYYWNDQ